MILRARFVFVAAAAAGFWAPEVSAAEAYLCGADNIVYVEVEDLERMKHTDPCIAGYYGLKVDAKGAPAPLADAPPHAASIASAAAVATLRPLPQVKPTSSSSEMNVPRRAPVLRSAARSTVVTDTAPNLRPLLVADESADVWLGGADTATSPGPVVAAAGTDYRNIRVINAKSPADMWFHLH